MNKRDRERTMQYLSGLEDKKFAYYGDVYELISLKDDIAMLQSVNDDTYVTMPIKFFLRDLRRRNIQQVME